MYGSIMSAVMSAARWYPGMCSAGAILVGWLEWNWLGPGAH